MLVSFEPSDPCAYGEGRLLVRSLARILQPCANHAGALGRHRRRDRARILDAWDIQRLTLSGEVEPGLPWSIADCAGRDIVVLTKAGSFGTRETLFRCREFLRNIAPDSATNGPKE